MKKFTPQKMVGWFEVKQLGGTAIRAILSSIFGSYADKRETLASLSEPEFYKYTDKRDVLAATRKEEVYEYPNSNDVWFDYISDTGDGFDSTFSMAHLISQPSVVINTPEGELELKRGKVVVFGGDQVYPTPSKTEYENRFIGPFEAASLQTNPEVTTEMYVLPGNHDWYDGLTNFVKIFCNGKTIGGFKTKQNRSYFAIELPDNLWIWGIDVQLQSDIDDLQIDYFNWVATTHMAKGSKVILCTPEPAWVYKSLKKEDHSYDSLELFEKNVIEGNGMKQILAIAGDLHHYARYTQLRQSKPALYKLTAGGGGAFLHPTHNLPKTLINLHDGEFDLTETFPRKRTSKGLTYLNVFFPYINPGFGLFLSSIHLIMAYTLYNTSLHDDLPGTLFTDFSEDDSLNDPIVIKRLFSTFVHSPIAMLILFTFIYGFKSFCDGKSSKYKLANLAGVGHGIAHICLMIILFSVITWFTNAILHIPSGLESAIAVSLQVFFIGGLLSGILMGMYLIISNLIFKMHDNEAFSSLKIGGFKNFLRFHLKDNVLTVYPIGIRRAPVWKRAGNLFKTRTPLKPQLVDKPIVIDLSKF